MLEENQSLEEIRKAFQEAKEKYDKNAEEYWSGLTEDEKLLAFYAVIKRTYKAEVEDKGTFRYALYDVFDFDASAYKTAMDCGYLDIHNLICSGLEYEELKAKGLMPDDKTSDSNSADSNT